MMLRQYKRIRAKEKRAFSYGKIKKVYLIVLYEASPQELRHMPNAYLHRSRHVFDTELKMDLLQRCVLISLDIFKKSMQNKAISTLQEAWLTFLSENDPKRLVELFEAFPQFIAMYETLYSMDKDMVRTMGFFSKELRIMDQNTVQYMIDEMEGTIDRLQVRNEELEMQSRQLEAQSNQWEEQSNQLQAQNNQLQAEKAQIQTQLQAEIQQLRAELQRLQGHNIE